MSTINRGPLGSAFLINRDPNQSGANGSASANGSNNAGPSTATATPPPAPEAKPAPASGAIPMPGPTLANPSPTPMSSSATLTAPAAPAPASSSFAAPGAVPAPPPKGSLITTDLVRSLAEVKGQAQFLLYLADQIEDSLHQLVEEHDDCQNSFLCRILSMYSGQLETKHHGLGDKIAETCQEVYVTVREYDLS